MFERPTKNDLDTALSMLMHESRHKLMDQVNRIKGDAIKAGALQSNGVIVTAISAADAIHKEAMEQAHTILLNFIERMERAPTEIVGWARPHLDNLNNSVLAVVPPNGFPHDHQRLTNQYRAVFQQRSDNTLRNVEIGHQKGTGFARAEKVESKEKWISAAEAIGLLAPGGKDQFAAKMALCKRAHAGMVRSRAQRFIIAGRVRDNVELPPVFWWAEGHEALHQNWHTGDFDTWPDSGLLSRDLRLSAGKVHLEAFDVSFLRSDLEKMIPADLAPPPPPALNSAAAAEPARNKGGRPRHEFWEELWVEIARQLYIGDLKPKTQADIEAAMHQWIADQGREAGGTTIRDRARMLWRAIEKDGN
ncbi:hypothetical protein [Bradyrhizobium sp. 170]|uniref:hypothetical protein n=1 Tax=Bradyrhizobium sp. 170 TaxID=2782641 RepID=UPI0020000A3C|nr:hypothetical protein [Bradyrhizobium sp. 170]UPK00506.1 hypothetical protein IVB05_22370 [Bradyrhizobium sp. 170]